MSKLAISRRKTEICEADNTSYEVLAPEQRDTSGQFFSFSFSHTEVSLQRGRTRVKSRSARFEDGKLETQTFEGELDRRAYDQVVDHSQRLLTQQASMLLQSLSWFLPFARKRKTDRD
jgi:hypothetical protein